MTSSTTVKVAGLGLFLPGFPSAPAWTTGEIDPELPKPTGLILGRINKRRAGALGRSVADCAAEALAQAGVEPSEVSIIVGSSIGEASTMVGLLEQMWRTKTPMSPAAFTVSVHNASSGLLSIGCENQGYVTSLAADEDTPAAALLEAIGLVHQKEAPVLVVCADEPAPECLVEEGDAWGLVASAVVLVPSEFDAPRMAALEVVASEDATLAPAEVDSMAANNPQVGLLDLVNSILAGETGVVALDRGNGRGYGARLTFEDA